MEFNICFLDGEGRLSCLISAPFSDFPHAARYASEVMRASSCGAGFSRAEIHETGAVPDMPLVVAGAASRRPAHPWSGNARA